MKFLRRFLKPLRPGRPAPATLLPLRLERGPIYAVGDLHGCPDLLRGLQPILQADAALHPGRASVVLLGDMIDRGPDTAGLIDELLQPLGWADRLAIRGNHEEMMLAFLHDPQRHAAWLDHGGQETLRSYGLLQDRDDLMALPDRKIRQVLAAHLPEPHLNWLSSLPSGFLARSGPDQIVLAHAGYDPDLPTTAQRRETLICGGSLPRPGEGICLVQGHEVQAEVLITPCRIAVDTGAWATGRISAVRLAAGHAPKAFTHDRNTVRPGAAFPHASAEPEGARLGRP